MAIVRVAMGAAGAAAPRAPATWRPSNFLLALVGLGLCGHALIHAYASRLANTGGLLRVISASGHRIVSDDSAAVVTTGCKSASRKLSVLLIHEHHLKPIGSDVRLFGVVLQLRSLGHTVSLLFRGKTPAEQRSPQTSELAALIGTTAGDSEVLLSSSTVAPRPPAIYEHVDLDSLSLLARQGWFDVVLCPLWFWRDPMASAAELLLPTLALHAPPARRPFVAVLSDDAHSAKASMMAEWESSEERKAIFQEKALTLPRRQRAVYALADAVVHISTADSQLERASFNESCARWHVLRMSPRGVRTAGAGADAALPAATVERSKAWLAANGGTSRFGFMGNGITPTNHLAVQWFLLNVWPRVRDELPGVRLRLVGFPPDDRPKRLQQRPCSPADSPVRCGWAWGTPFAGAEAAGGIDELGFIADEQMLEELLTWKAMVVPILRSTGVNTKLLPALQWGVPAILTTVAASPLGIPTDESVALIADSADDFVRRLQQVHSSPAEAQRLAAAARAHWQRLLAEDATASDLTPLLAMACDVLNDPKAVRPMPAPVSASASASSQSSLVADLSAADKQPSLSRCFSGSPPAVHVAMHGAAATEAAVILAHAAWAAVCVHCALSCEHSRGGRRPPSEWDVLIEHEATATPTQTAAGLAAAAAAIAPRPLRFVHAPAAQFPAALGMYSVRGGVLASVAYGELARAHLPAALDAAGIGSSGWVGATLEPIANGTKGAAVGVTWRSLLTQIGMRSSEVTTLVPVIERVRSRLQSAAPKWLGCYRDHAADRDMNQGPRTPGHTTLACAAACMGYPYFALQNGGQCFCGSQAANQTRRTGSAQCGRVCATEEGKLPPRLCGGVWRNAFYSNPAVLMPEELHMLNAAPPPPPKSIRPMGKTPYEGLKPQKDATSARDKREPTSKRKTAADKPSRTRRSAKKKKSSRSQSSASSRRSKRSSSSKGSRSKSK